VDGIDGQCRWCDAALSTLWREPGQLDSVTDGQPIRGFNRLVDHGVFLRRPGRLRAPYAERDWNREHLGRIQQKHGKPTDRFSWGHGRTGGKAWRVSGTGPPPQQVSSTGARERSDAPACARSRHPQHRIRNGSRLPRPSRSLGPVATHVDGPGLSRASRVDVAAQIPHPTTGLHGPRGLSFPENINQHIFDDVFLLTLDDVKDRGRARRPSD
jgi:hypothetical protein